MEMLQYLVQHMDPTWARRMLMKIASVLERKLPGCMDAARTGVPLFRNKADHDSDVEVYGVHWPAIILLARHLGDELPTGLAKIAAVRSKRARALAGVVYQAGKVAKEGQPHPSLSTWAALARLPPDLRERIACEAHLAISDRALPC